jgi:hypothetical protein
VLTLTSGDQARLIALMTGAPASVHAQLNTSPGSPVTLTISPEAPGDDASFQTFVKFIEEELDAGGATDIEPDYIFASA